MLLGWMALPLLEMPILTPCVQFAASSLSINLVDGLFCSLFDSLEAAYRFFWSRRVRDSRWLNACPCFILLLASLETLFTIAMRSHLRWMLTSCSDDYEVVRNNFWYYTPKAATLFTMKHNTTLRQLHYVRRNLSYHALETTTLTALNYNIAF